MRGWTMLIAAFALAGCGSKEKDDLAALDAQLTNNAADPAIRGALESPILVDPELAQQSDALSVKPGERPVDGAVPVLQAPRPNDAEVLAAVGGKLLKAPQAKDARPCPECGGQPLTLGALAREGSKRVAPRRRCDARLEYGMEWAQRLPEPLTLYPKAKLMDAAGSDAGCAIRAASFIAAAPMEQVIDFYYTQARRAGYDVAHELLDGAHALGGTRAGDDGAVFLTFAAAPGGGTAVDMVVNNGR